MHERDDADNRGLFVEALVTLELGVEFPDDDAQALIQQLSQD